MCIHKNKRAIALSQQAFTQEFLYRKMPPDTFPLFRGKFCRFDAVRDAVCAVIRNGYPGHGSGSSLYFHAVGVNCDKEAEILDGRCNLHVWLSAEHASHHLSGFGWILARVADFSVRGHAIHTRCYPAGNRIEEKLNPPGVWGRQEINDFLTGAAWFAVPALVSGLLGHCESFLVQSGVDELPITDGRVGGDLSGVDGIRGPGLTP